MVVTGDRDGRVASGSLCREGIRMIEIAVVGATGTSTAAVGTGNLQIRSSFL
jgi:hypothetical protein